MLTIKEKYFYYFTTERKDLVKTITTFWLNEIYDVLYLVLTNIVFFFFWLFDLLGVNLLSGLNRICLEEV